MEAGNWYNYAALAGVQYKYPSSPTLEIHLTGQVGINFVQVPFLNLSIDTVFDNIEFETASDFAWSIGGALVINQNMVIGVRYVDGGKPQLKGKSSSNLEDNTQPEPMKQPIGITLITLGYRF